MIEGYYDEDEIAQFMHKKRSTLAKDRSLGVNHPPFVKVGAMVKYPKDEFHRWMHARMRREYADEQHERGRPFTQKKEKIRVGSRR